MPSNYSYTQTKHSPEYTLLKDNYLARTESLFQDIYYMNPTEDSKLEIGKIVAVQHILINNLDIFQNATHSLRSDIASEYQTVIKENLELAAKNIESINKEITTNGAETNDFKNVKYKQMVAFMLEHLGNWQSELEQLNDEIRVSGYTKVDIEKTFAPSDTAQKVNTALINNASNRRLN